MDQYYTTQTTLTDLEGNVIGLSTSNYSRRKKYAERFVYLYENKWTSWLKTTKSAATIKVFHALSCLLDIGKPTVFLSPKQRRTILEDYGITDVSFCAALNELEKEYIIIRKNIVNPETGEVVRSFHRGEIMINPSLVWKGNATSRKEATSTYFSYVDLIEQCKKEESTPHING